MLASVKLKVLTPEEKAIGLEYGVDYDAHPGATEVETGLYFSHQLEFWTVPALPQINYSISSVTGEFADWNRLIDDPNFWERAGDLLSTYGVADNLEQIVRYYEATIRNPEVRAAISVYPIWREHQPDHNGWRWHKNGEYIGAQNPQHEYLADDTHIKYVLSFHIHPVTDDVFAGQLLGFDEALRLAQEQDEEAKDL